jgi:FAM91 N-terminus
MDTGRTVQRPVVSTLPPHGSVSMCPHLLLCAQLFPYHLASYVCQVLRTTPFKYYCDLLFSVMREERSYDFIPNFTVGGCAGLHLCACVLVAHAHGHCQARLPGGCWVLSAELGAHAGS